MIDKLQDTYNKLIHQSNMQWHLSKSKEEEWKDKSYELQTLAYAFQESAAYIAFDFPEIKVRMTDRERDIREHHMSEEPSEDRSKEKTEV